MGYNGSNRVGYDRGYQGFSKSSVNFGNRLLFGSGRSNIGLIILIFSVALYISYWVILGLFELFRFLYILTSNKLARKRLFKTINNINGLKIQEEIVLNYNDIDFFEDLDNQFKKHTGKPFSEVRIVGNRKKCKLINIILLCCGIISIISAFIAAEMGSYVCFILLLISLGFFLLSYYRWDKVYDEYGKELIFGNFVNYTIKKYKLKYITNCDAKYGKLTMVIDLSDISKYEKECKIRQYRLIEPSKSSCHIDKSNFKKLVIDCLYFYRIYIYSEKQKIIINRKAYDYNDIISFGVFNYRKLIYSASRTADDNLINLKTSIGKYRNTECANSYSIIIIVNDLSSPHIEIEFDDKETKLIKFASALEVIIKCV